MEKIVAAAILLNNNIYVGKRHCEIINNAIPFGYFKHADAIQGFYTSEFRFVDREMGAIIAFKSQQITEEKEVLFSEDLW
jgi:hypothetical protein